MGMMGMMPPPFGGGPMGMMGMGMGMGMGHGPPPGMAPPQMEMMALGRGEPKRPRMDVRPAGPPPPPHDPRRPPAARDGGGGAGTSGGGGGGDGDSGGGGGGASVNILRLPHVTRALVMAFHVSFCQLSVAASRPFGVGFLETA